MNFNIKKFNAYTTPLYFILSKILSLVILFFISNNNVNDLYFKVSILTSFLSVILASSSPYILQTSKENKKNILIISLLFVVINGFILSFFIGNVLIICSVVQAYILVIISFSYSTLNLKTAKSLQNLLIIIQQPLIYLICYYYNISGYNDTHFNNKNLFYLLFLFFLYLMFFVIYVIAMSGNYKKTVLRGVEVIIVSCLNFYIFYKGVDFDEGGQGLIIWLLFQFASVFVFLSNSMSNLIINDNYRAQALQNLKKERTIVECILLFSVLLYVFTSLINYEYSSYLIYVYLLFCSGLNKIVSSKLLGLERYTSIFVSNISAVIVSLFVEYTFNIAVNFSGVINILFINFIISTLILYCLELRK